MSAQPRLDLAPARASQAPDTGLAPVAANDLAPGTVILAFADTAPASAYRSHHMFSPPPAKVAEAIMRRLTCPADDLEIKTNQKTGNVGIWVCVWFLPNARCICRAKDAGWKPTV
jgi:hypothetical protein